MEPLVGQELGLQPSGSGGGSGVFIEVLGQLHDHRWYLGGIRGPGVLHMLICPGWKWQGLSVRSPSFPGFWVERTPVHEAAQRGESLQLQQLIESGACVNQVTVDSITPLHAASLQGQARCVQLLLAAGAQVDARNIDGSTPLCDACASGSIECVKLLLSYGAKVNPPLYTASPLHEACMSGANVNAAKLHETALHHAAKVKNVDLIEMLIEFGGNIYARDNRGKKPSDYTWSSSAPAKCLEYYESEAPTERIPRPSSLQPVPLCAGSSGELGCSSWLLPFALGQTLGHFAGAVCAAVPALPGFPVARGLGQQELQLTPAWAPDLCLLCWMFDRRAS
nr:ankyrin repeat and SOCS box protein 13 isoform X2 [Aotus nancymaae]